MESSYVERFSESVDHGRIEHRVSSSRAFPRVSTTRHCQKVNKASLFFMADSEVVTQLGGFALGEVLTQLNLDEDTIDHAKRGLGVSTANFSRDSIYNGKFVDDNIDNYDPVTDLEAQVDRDMKNDKYSRPITKPLALVRGEEDEYDDDDDEQEEDRVQGGETQVKQEDQDDLNPDEEDTTYRAQSADIITPMPPMKQVNVAELFPSFQVGKTLDFTKLFLSRPRKRPKLAFAPVKCAFLLPQLEMEN